MSDKLTKFNKFREYRVVWQACPHVHNPSRVLFVEAMSQEDAEKLAKDHVERKFGVGWFTIQSVTEVEPLPAGAIRG